MERTYIFANGLPYMSRYYLFLCLTSDCNNLHTVKVKFRGQPVFLLKSTLRTVKPLFLSTKEAGPDFIII